jgi:REP element-mobilizing transposase RayT
MREASIERGAHSIARLNVHLVWATRDREPWLDASVDYWLSLWLEKLSIPLGCRALAVGNASDHVHVLVAFPPTAYVRGQREHHRQPTDREPWDPLCVHGEGARSRSSRGLL